MKTRGLFRSCLRVGIGNLAFGLTALAADTGINSPNGSIQLKLQLNGPLRFGVVFQNKAIVETSPMHLSLDGIELTDEVKAGQLEPYRVNETYAWRGVHSRATNNYNGLKIELTHPKSRTQFMLDLRIFNEAAAFRFIIPGTNRFRVPDEDTTFILPAKSTIWYHNLEGHYEGIYTNKDISEVQTGEWIAPPATFRLPDGVGYASITEADLKNYGGMALQSDGQRGLRVRLGHSHPPSHPYRQRYTQEDIDRLAKPAAIAGDITTPWRVIMIAPDLNALVNNDTVPNLCPPPDPAIFPKGLETDWIKPGRAVWKYLDGGGSNTIETVKAFTRMAAVLGFEHQVIEGFWSKWSDAEIKDLVAYSNKQKVSLWFWKHSKTLRDDAARHEFLERLHDLGVAGAKIDFFDHEAKEVVDLYQVLLKEAAHFHILLDFHGANKPTGESRTWPNELTREAVKGMEASKLADRATHDTTLPFTRLLAGPAEYTPLVFGPRRANTTYGHQIASAAILSAPLLTYGSNPSNMIASPCFEMIKSIPATWDETIVLEPSAIGELAAYARRIGNTWFLVLLNGPSAKKIKFPLTFLPRGDFKTAIVRDNQEGAAAQVTLETSLRASNFLTVELHEGGGFIARFQKK